MTKNLLGFLNDIVARKIDNKKSAKKKYLENFFDYNEPLKRQRIHQGSRNQRMLNYIASGDNGAEYIIFGPLFLPETENTQSEKDTNTRSEKLDIAQGGKSESDEETEQKGKRLKIMTPKQMNTRLLILLAQLKAGNNSEKLKNEIRQITFSIYYT